MRLLHFIPQILPCIHLIIRVIIALFPVIVEDPTTPLGLAVLEVLKGACAGSLVTILQEAVVVCVAAFGIEAFGELLTFVASPAVDLVVVLVNIKGVIIILLTYVFSRRVTVIFLRLIPCHNPL